MQTPIAVQIERGVMRITLYQAMRISLASLIRYAPTSEINTEHLKLYYEAVRQENSAWEELLILLREQFDVPGKRD